MRFRDDDNSTTYMAIAAVLLLVVVGVLGYIGWNIFGGQSVAVEPTANGAVAATAVVATDVPEVAEITVEDVEEEMPAIPDPTATPEPAPTASPTPSIDLRFGTINREDNCAVYSDIAMAILNQELDLLIEIIEYDDIETLLDALANAEIDVTLCFSDPTDRGLIADRLGSIRQIGTAYWQGEDSKLQVWANGTSKADMRDERPCALSLLENISFTDFEIDQTDGSEWVNEHSEQVADWVRCSN